MRIYVSRLILKYLCPTRENRWLENSGGAASNKSALLSPAVVVVVDDDVGDRKASQVEVSTEPARVNLSGVTSEEVMTFNPPSPRPVALDDAITLSPLLLPLDGVVRGPVVGNKVFIIFII